MNTSKSLSMIVSAADRDAANRLMRGLGRDNAPDPGKTFIVEFNSSGDRVDAVTDYGAHTWDDSLVAILDSGVLPLDINWGNFGLTKATAETALASIQHFAVVNRTPRINFNQKLTDRSLKGISSPL